MESITVELNSYGPGADSTVWSEYQLLPVTSGYEILILWTGMEISSSLVSAFNPSPSRSQLLL